MNESLYVDSSAVIKRFVPELGSEEAISAMDEAATLVASRVAYVEVWRTVAKVSEAATDRWDQLWPEHQVVELTPDVAEHAASLAAYHGLRSLDAIHLASALTLKSAMRFATWDARLWDAAAAVGLRRVPAERP